MGKRLLFILILLLMVRPIALVENLACGEETAVPDVFPTKETPCSDIVKAQEIVESSHHCPCFAVLQPDTAGIMSTFDSFTLLTALIFGPETAVDTPPTPPPRLV